MLIKNVVISNAMGAIQTTAVRNKEEMSVALRFRVTPSDVRSTVGICGMTHRLKSVEYVISPNNNR